MTTDSTPRAGRTRWRRFAAVTAPALAAALGIVALEAQGALAASFHVSGLPMVITADKMVGSGFDQYGFFDPAYENKAADIPSMIPVAITGIREAKLYNLCQSVTIPGFNVSMVITAGTDPDNPVTASDLFIDMSRLEGNATFKQIDIGIDAMDMEKGPKSDALIPQNMFGQQADSLVITNLKQTAYSTSAGTFTLQNMNMALKWGTYTCPQ